MRQRLTIFLSIILGVFLLSSGAMAYTIDGDVSDWGIDLNAAQLKTYLDTNTPTGGNDIDYVTEDNADLNSGTNTFVGPGYTHDGNEYDAEALYFDNDSTMGYIAIITGLDIDNTYGPGDIAINVTDSVLSNLWDDGVFAETISYEFAIKIIDRDTAELWSVTDWNSVYYDGNPSPDYGAVSDPYQIKEGSKIADIAFAYSTTEVNEHYVIEAAFSLADLGLSSGDFDLHWTMRCGNDVLDLSADVNPVPEPATLALLGLGLIGLAGIRRRVK